MIEEALLSVGLLIVVAKLAEGVFRQFKLNAIVAYAVTGVILGPVTGLVEVTSELNVLLGIGVFVFFFLIGLDEIDIAGFVAAMRGRFFIAAIVSVVISLLAALAVTSDLLHDFGLDLDFNHALALAGIMALSSLGLVAKVLADEGRLKDPLGIQLFTTVIIAELLALLVVGFSIGEHAEDLGAISVLVLLGQIVGFTVATWFLATRVVPRILLLLQRVLRVPQLSFGLLLGGLFLIVVGAEEIGLHGSIGALLFGAALSGLPHQVRQTVMPGIRSTAEGLFVPLFFASAGLHLSFAFAELPALTIVALVLIPLAGKFVGAFIGASLTRLDISFPLATGLLAKGVAEIALLLVLFETHVIDQAVFSLLVLIMFVYILFMPPLISFAVNRAKTPERSDVPEAIPPSLARFTLDDATVQDIMDRSWNYPESTLSVRSFADRWTVPHQQDYVVVDHGALAGIVSLSKLRYLPKTQWSQTPLENVMIHDLPKAYPDEHLEDALQRMTEHSLTVIPVVDRESNAFLGTVTSRDVLDLMLLDAKGEH